MNTIMDVIHHQQAAREAQLLQANREELVERIGRAIPEDGTVQPLLGLHLVRCSEPLVPVHGVLEPSVCVIAQGSKQVLLGESRYQYDPSHYLLATIELPSVGQVLSASKKRPYLSLRLELAPTLVSSVMLEASYSSPPSGLRSRPSMSARWMGPCWTPSCDSRGCWMPLPKRRSSGL